MGLADLVRALPEAPGANAPVADETPATDPTPA
jgi:hypothetical protein